MLIITRRIGEAVIINDNITVTFLGYNGNQAQIAFDAPKSIPICRKEIYLKTTENYEDMEKDEKE